MPKWLARPHLIIKYENESPGLVFGIIRLCDIFRDESSINQKIEIGNRYNFRIGECFNKSGIVIYIGSYNNCYDQYSILWDILRLKRNFKLNTNSYL